MSDTNALRTQLASELNRALTDSFGNSGETFATAINRAINGAIQHYESDAFRWNQVFNSEFATTVAGTRTYSLPQDFIRMDTLKLIYSGSYLDIEKKSFKEIDAKDKSVSSGRGVPSEYATYANVLRLYPPPVGAYTLVASYMRRYLPTSVTGSYTAVIPFAGSYSMTVTTTASHNNRLNGWTTDGAELIRARAKAALQVNYLKDAAAISEAQSFALSRQPYLCAREALAYLALVDETEELAATGLIRPYCI